MDKLSPEVRAAEVEIDSVYKLNPLVQSDFAVSAWNVLGVIEDSLFFQGIKDREVTAHKLSAAADTYIVTLKHPLHWLRAACSSGGRVPTSYDGDDYQAAMDLVMLAVQYDQFYLAFTYASRGLIDLRVEGDTLVPTHDFLSQLQYEVYNRLVKPIGGTTSEENTEKLEAIHAEIRRSLQIRGENFTVNINPKLVCSTRDFLELALEKMFLLPEEWKFTRYSLSDFKQVYNSILALAYIQYRARAQAARLGCVGLGFSNCLFLPTKEELLNRVTRYTGLTPQIASEVIHDLTLGSYNITPERGDPALQPLISLNEERYAVAPFLWMYGSGERNFISLMNKIPQEKSIYSRLVHQKEDLMRERIKLNVQNTNLRTWNGRIAGHSDLPDIDLALIDDSEKVCILLELKWFLDPAEAKEIIEKSEEIAKGISQLLRLKRIINEQHAPLFERLGINSSYSFGVALVSANWIGHAFVQNPEVAVIREDHLIKKSSATDSLADVISWLSRRSYLPEEGKHYEIVHTSPRVGKWEMEWYGIRPLVAHTFMPV
jgi:hypothetical protein